MKHILITGHSKGLGAGIAAALIKAGHHIHGLSRTDNPELKKLAEKNNCSYSFYAIDLAETGHILKKMNDVFETITGSDNLEGVYLINNAGIIHPIGPVPANQPEDIETHLKINLHAPMILIAEFIRRTAGLKVQKRVLNISSGAASNPYHGWSTYCTGKAALDMFTRCCATEQENISFPVEFMAVAPGIIDTEMQTTIRAVGDEQFIHKQKFVELKETGKLVPPDVAGNKLAELLLSTTFKNGDIIDIRGLY
jgi:benzil reductase ((S)-benzoin forming)